MLLLVLVLLLLLLVLTLLVLQVLLRSSSVITLQSQRWRRWRRSWLRCGKAGTETLHRLCGSLLFRP